MVQPPTDTESTTLDIGGFSDTSQSLPGLNEGISKKVSFYLAILIDSMFKFLSEFSL